jgi:hypothetical protein
MKIFALINQEKLNCMHPLLLERALLAVPTVFFGSHIFKNASKSKKTFNLTKITHYWFRSIWIPIMDEWEMRNHTGW